MVIDDIKSLQYSFQQVQMQGMFANEESGRKQFSKMTEKQFQEKYLDMQYLGHGAYGDVWKARTIHNHQVAIKKFKVNTTQQYFYSIVRQVSCLKKLKHPNIVQLYDCYQVDENKYYLVTEFCPGGTLTDFLQQEHTEDEKILMCLQLAEGLAFAHEKGIVHRDIKPENVLIGKKNVAKICDFGCSTIISVNQLLVSRVGSKSYMDHRIYNNSQYDNTVDIYSLGLVFFAAFNEGIGLYDQMRTQNEMNRVKSKIYSDYDKNIEEYLINIPPILKPIIKNCLSQDYQSRFSAAEIAKQLSDYLGNKLNSKLISTQDQGQDIILREGLTQFSCELMRISKEYEEQIKSKTMQKRILSLFESKKEVINKMRKLERLKNVKKDTKAQFSFLVLFVYSWWLDQMKKVFQEQKVYGQLSEIKINLLNQTAIDYNKKLIQSEQNRISAFLNKCARLSYSLFKLMRASTYVPVCFREMVTGVIQNTTNYNLFTEKELGVSIRQFFDLRIRKQYKQRLGNNVINDEDFFILESIKKDFPQ